jgi:F-type H+-transporting ATPase subunit delta
MKGIKIVTNYAFALFTSAVELGVEEKILEQIKQINRVIDADSDIKTIMESPVVTSTDKTKVLESIVGGFEINAILMQFLLLLIKNSRISFLPKIIHSYNLLLDESKNIKMVKLTSCKVLEVLDKEWIKTYLEKDLGQKVEIEFHQDPSIIGGIIVEYDSIRIDYSILGALNKIKRITEAPKINFLIG